jgi:hypothetical protein
VIYNLIKLHLIDHNKVGLHYKGWNAVKGEVAGMLVLCGTQLLSAGTMSILSLIGIFGIVHVEFCRYSR